MSILYRAFHRCFLPSFGSFGQAVSEKKIFLLRPIRNKNCLWRPCLLMDRDKMSNLYKRPSIDASYQASVHLAEGFQRRRLKCEKLTDDGCQVMAKAQIALARWANNRRLTLALITHLEKKIYLTNPHCSLMWSYVKSWAPMTWFHVAFIWMNCL